MTKAQAQEIESVATQLNRLETTVRTLRDDLARAVPDSTKDRSAVIARFLADELLQSAQRQIQRASGFLFDALE